MDGTTQIGSAVSNPASGVASFAANLRIPASSTKTLSIIGDVPSSHAVSATNTNYIKFSVPGAGTIADDITSTGVMSTADVVETGAATGNLLTVAVGTIATSETTVASNIVINSADVTLGNIILTAGIAEMWSSIRSSSLTVALLVALGYYYLY